MKRYAKILRFPGLGPNPEYEYRYICCDREYRIKFRRLTSGPRKGRFVEISCEGEDLRIRDEVFQTDRCPECGVIIPRPWMGPDKDAFLEDWSLTSTWIKE